MNLRLERQPSYKAATFGSLSIDGEWFCYTLEDMIREIADVPVDIWKVRGVTAIPQGHYQVTLELSPKFGADTITINRVPGFQGVRIHGGNTVADTEGCPLVGSHTDRERGTISGAKADGVLADLKAKIKGSPTTVWIDIVNPEPETMTA